MNAINASTYFAQVFTIVAGVDRRILENLLNLGNTEPSSRNFANHLNLLRDGGKSNSMIGSGQPDLPNVDDIWHRSLSDSESYLGGGSIIGSEMLHKPGANTGSHSGSMAVTPETHKRS